MLGLSSKLGSRPGSFAFRVAECFPTRFALRYGIASHSPLAVAVR